MDHSGEMRRGTPEAMTAPFGHGSGHFSPGRILAIGIFAVAAFAQDAATMLEQARNKVLASTSGLPKYVCVETIDRSYYSRQNAPDTPPSCERLALDRKRGQDRFQLDKTDRLRVAVSIVQGLEIYSWTGTAPYAHSVENILNGGPIGTGPFAAHLLDIFTNPGVRFRLLSEPSDMLDYGFRVPVEASRFIALAGSTWLPAGYSGSLRIDRGSLDLRRIEVVTDELPAETTLCEESTVLEFRGASLLPAESQSHDILRDATETDSVFAISGCREVPASPPPVPARSGEPLPPGLRLSVMFDADIDSDTAAAGDPISATVPLPLWTSGRVVDAGAKVTGRIVHMEHTHAPQSQFLISVAFDTLVQKGVASPFYAKLIGPSAAIEMGVEGSKLTGHGLEDWPHGMFGFRTPKGKHRYVVPAGFKSTWVTVAPAYLK
jgi:hypothetical protein